MLTQLSVCTPSRVHLGETFCALLARCFTIASLPGSAESSPRSMAIAPASADTHSIDPITLLELVASVRGLSVSGMVGDMPGAGLRWKERRWDYGSKPP